MPKAIVETRPNRKLTEFFTPKEPESTMPSSSSSSAGKNATTKLKRSTQVTQVPNSKRSGNSSKPNSKQTMSSSQPKKAVNVVSAEDSDDDDIQLPAIVLTSSQASVDTISLTPKARITAKPFRNSPLTPRQNLEFPLKHSITPVKSLVLLSSPKSTLKRSGSKTCISKPASPLKRPRCRSPKEIVVISSDSEVANDGDDEKAPLSAVSSSSVESTSELETAMDIDLISFPILSTPLVPFDSTITTPKSKRTNEVVPSSQHGEMETDEWEIGFTTTSASGDEKKMEMEKDSRLGQLNTDLSPCSARTLSIINQIKANAEREAAKEAKEANTRLSLGLTDNESDLSELSDSSDDLSLDLDTFMNDKAQTRSGPKPQSDMPQAQNVRRSARNNDVPAPNYKLKLSLIRDTSPTPAARAPRPPQKCPLDKILKESAYLKASAEASRQASSRATSVDHMRDETSSFSHHTSDDHHVDFDDSPFFDTSITIEDSTREGILGKKASDAVGKILHDDREKRKAGTSARTETFSVWDDAAMVTEDTIPSLHLSSHTSPLTALLQQALRENNYDMAVVLIGSGALYGLSQSSEFLSWLFKLVFTTQSQQLSTSAYKALLILQPGKLSSGWLTEQLFHSILQRLGLRETVLQVSNVGQSRGIIEDNDSKIMTISRLLTLLAKFARSQALPEAIIPSVTVALLVLGLDELISSHLYCDTITTIEAILSEQKFSTETELSICKAVHQAIVKLTLPFNQQLRLVGLLSGSSPVSDRIRRWIAWSMLGGDLGSISDITDLSSSFSVILNLFSTKNDAPGSVKMIIHNEVDYAILGAQTEILSAFMTDVEGFARRPDGGNSGKDFVEGVFRNLANLLSKIYDTRAAHLDRSKTKDAMNRLRNRLEYQLEAAMHLIRPRKSVLHHFFEKKPKSMGAKS